MPQAPGSREHLLICGVTVDLLSICCLWVCTDLSNHAPCCFLPNSGKTRRFCLACTQPLSQHKLENG